MHVLQDDAGAGGERQEQEGDPESPFASHQEQQKGEQILAIQDLMVKDNRGISAVNGLSLELHKGEILGIAGVDGNGQSELVEALTGLRKVAKGTITLHGKDITGSDPNEVINKWNIRTIPEDRQKRGLVMEFDVAENLILETYHDTPFSNRGVLNREKIYAYADDCTENFDIRPTNPYLVAKSLSGGNQQKVIIAREVSNDPEVLIASQPTRGLDVGAIEYVHTALVNQRDKGKAVLLISFELDEIMNVSDRIAVIFEGKIVGIVDAKGVDENEVGLMMAGGTR